MENEAIDLGAVGMMSSVSSSSTVFVEDKCTIGRITLEQLKKVLDSM